MKSMDLVLDDVFGEQVGKTDQLFGQYEKLYGLPIVPFQAQIPEGLLDYVAKRKNFVSVLLYDNDGNVYMDPTIADTLYFGLPGGGIRNNETVQNTITRVAKSVHPQLLIGDVEPLARIENRFTHGEDTYTQDGLAFAGRVRNKSMIKQSEFEGSFVRVTQKDLESIKRLSSRQVVELFNKRFSEIQQRSGSDFQDEEISTNEKYKKRYIIHNNLVKKFVLTDERKKKSEFRDIIAGSIGKDTQSIIDVSCGEDSFIPDLGKSMGIPLIVGNDISWSQIELLNQKHDDVLFTNHNGTALPFVENAFDVSYCANTLHHMPNRQALLSLLESMFHVSKKMILTEIEDPKEIGGFPHWLNKNWFMGYLKDVGGAYLKEGDFQSIVHNLFKGRADVKLQNFKNIMGKYMIATITKDRG
ncbi:MAG: class I SAM-dependent methyltransferase [Firmicutes bacterium]|nr:class I SAM-dependent methyltransferase [Bacillota bacterium]